MLLAGWTQPAGIGASRLMAGLALLLGLGACDGASKPASSLEVADKGAFSAALSADGSYAVVGSLTHGGSLWDVDTGERRFNWNHRAGEYSPITSAAISPDAGYAITAADNSLVAWNTASGAALTFFSAPAQVLSLALGPQGEHALLVCRAVAGLGKQGVEFLVGLQRGFAFGPVAAVERHGAVKHVFDVETGQAHGNSPGSEGAPA